MAFVQRQLIIGDLVIAGDGSSAPVQGFGDTRGFAVHLTVVDNSGGNFYFSLEDSPDGISWGHVAQFNPTGPGVYALRTTQPTADRVRLAWKRAYGSGPITVRDAWVSAS